MLIYSLPENGFLYFDGIESDISAELALVLGAKVADVQVVVNFLLKFGLMEQVDDMTFRLTQVEEMVGRECEAAARMRKHREKMANLPKNGEKASLSYGRASQCYTDVTKCYTEIDIEKEKEKEKEKDIEIERDIREKSPAPSAKKKKPERHKYGEYNNVLLSDAEMEKLKAEIPEYMEYIDRLSGYMQSTGKVYKDHLATIRNWRRADLKKQTVKVATPVHYSDSGFFDGIYED